MTALIRPHDRLIYEVRLKQVGSHAVETFDVTDDHLWMSKSGHWLTTLNLVIGSQIQTESGKNVRVVSVTDTRQKANTYNLEVADFHTYFVGADEVWGHNAPCPKALSPVWQALQNWRQGIRTDETYKYTWDYLHNEIEKFNWRGNYLGALDPETGVMIKPAVDGRTLDQ